MIKVTELADMLGGVIIGSREIEIDRVVELNNPTPGGLGLVRQRSDLNLVSDSLADVIIGPNSITNQTNATVIAIEQLNAKTLNAFLTWYKVNTYRLDQQRNCSHIDDVYIGQYTEIGENCHFKPGVRIMNGVKIGNNVAIHCNTVIKEGTIIGNNVTIDSNCSIGNYSFEYLNDENGNLIRLESIGRVIIEDNAEIGCNTSIDRGTIGNTVIGEGSKLDNQIQIGHDVKLGKNCLLVSQVGIAGWTRLEDGVVVHGQAGITGGVTIGKNSRIKAQAGVTRSCPANSHLSGYPARETNEYLKTLAVLNKLVKSRKEQPAASQQAVDSQPSWLRRIFNF
ncbi:UDP-3-O-(3-hydroxymyristoyl)glucosamine N-acyltransferase [Vibrio maritimus]